MTTKARETAQTLKEEVDNQLQAARDELDKLVAERERLIRQQQLEDAHIFELQDRIEILSKIAAKVEDAPSEQTVLRKQALLARLAKTDLSPEARLATLREGARAGVLTDEQSNELGKLLAESARGHGKRRRTTP